MIKRGGESRPVPKTIRAGPCLHTIPHTRVLRSEEPGTVSTCHVQTVRLSSVGLIPQLAPYPRKRRLASNAPYVWRNFPKGFTYMLLR